MQQTVQSYDKNPHIHNVTQVEITKRRNIANALKAKSDNYEKQFNSQTTQNQVSQTPKFQEKPKVIQENREPTFQNQNFQNQNIELQELKQKQTSIQDQDKQIDQLFNNVTNIKNMGQVINKELETDLKIIEELNNNVDKTQQKIEKAKDRLGQMLTKTSSNCLFWTIIFEILVFILLISFL